jgi:hypothetical protein
LRAIAAPRLFKHQQLQLSQPKVWPGEQERQGDKAKAKQIH